ncbi:MAG: AAA family ATPase [Desulfobacterales bacterium]
MYLSFYNLKVKPFQMSTDPDFLWLGKQHKEALATLKYAIRENKGLLALTGEVGTGKTTLINALIQSLEDDKVAATIYDPSFDVLEFFNVISAAFNLGKTFESKGKFIDHFREFLQKAHKRKQKVLLIIDEAQGINSETLEEIRLLSNLEEDHIRLLNIFFVGQNEFIDILQEYKNRALRQRIAVRYHLEPLKISETEAYVRHRLHVSGTEAQIFSQDAIEEIFVFSDGYPRMINIICDHALLRGYVQQLNTINANIVRESGEELLISRKSSKYPVHDQGIPSPEAPGGTPAGGPGIPDQDWGFSDDGQRFIGQDTDIIVPEDSPRPVKRRTVPLAIGVVLLAMIGAAAGYVYYHGEENMIKSRIVSFLKQKDVSHSMKVPPTNDTAPVRHPVSQLPEITDKIQDKTVEDPRFFTGRPLEPESFEKIAPIKGEPLEAVPSPRFAGESRTPFASEKTGAPIVLAPGSGSKETVKAATPTEGKASGAVSPGRSKKSFVAALVPDKTSGAVSTSASTPAKPPAQPKISETAQQDYGKRVEKPAAVEPAPKLVQTQKEPSDKDLTAAEKLTVKEASPVGSSVFSKKPATGPAAAVNPPAQTAAVKEEPTVVHQMVTQEKERSAAAMPEKKSVPVQEDAQAVYLKGPAAEPETVAKQTVSPYNLQDRLKTFLRAYCRTYEQKNLDMFGAFFAPDALEQGKPFKSWASQYRQNFNKIDSMIYNIELERYATQDESGQVRIEGIFHVRAKLSGSGKWRKSSGRITMVLEPNKDSFRVKELIY